MKKSILFISITLLAIPMALAKDVITKDVEKLPVQAKEMIATHFPNEKISYIKIDKEFLSTTYEVTFVSGTEIDFYKDGSWKEIDCKRLEVPLELVPEEVVLYVKSNFGEEFITQIEKTKVNYKVELSNDLDLYFDKSGKFLWIED